MKVVIENKIPFIRGILEPVAKVIYAPHEKITPALVAEADALIVRTRTRCDAALLEGSRVKWIATATIGMDHIDLDYCVARGIRVVNASGCNAPAVAQYLFAALNRLFPDGLEGKTIGVVGVGNIGSIVARWARSAAMTVLECDPPRARREDSNRFVDIDRIAAEADIITFHVPMTMSGEDSTFHLADSNFYHMCKQKPVIVNAARGPVVDTSATIDAIDNNLIKAAIIDCWEGEPNINLQLLDRAVIATPHVAGYSLQGKQRATMMVIDAFAKDHNLDPRALGKLPFERPKDPDNSLVTPHIALYDISADDRALRASPASFETLRDNYNYRSEY